MILTLEGLNSPQAARLGGFHNIVLSLLICQQLHDMQHVFFIAPALRNSVLGHSIAIPAEKVEYHIHRGKDVMTAERPEMSG